jgi:hypothetical protein
MSRMESREISHKNTRAANSSPVDVVVRVDGLDGEDRLRDVEPGLLLGQGVLSEVTDT